jgi:hypothetical protein
MNKTSAFIACATTLLAGSIACAESATSPTLFMDMSVNGMRNLWADSFGVTSANSSLWNFEGKEKNDNGGMTYAIYADPDPILGFDFSFFNNTGITQTFNVIVTLPVAPWANATNIGASIGASVTDADFSGNAALSSVGGGSVFKGDIDGTTWLPLFTNINVTAPFTGGTSTISDVDGLPGPANPGPFGVTTDISITLTFDLTAGDRASFTGVFIVEYVPAPASALAFLGLGILGRRRRN